MNIQPIKQVNTFVNIFESYLIKEKHPEGELPGEIRLIILLFLPWVFQLPPKKIKYNLKRSTYVESLFIQKIKDGCDLTNNYISETICGTGQRITQQSRSASKLRMILLVRNNKKKKLKFVDNLRSSIKNSNNHILEFYDGNMIKISYSY